MDEMSNMSTVENGKGQPNRANRQISRKLREFYDSVQDEGIPDRFLDLLEKLDEAEKASKLVEKE